MTEGGKTIVVVHSRPDTVSGAELAIADIVDRRREDFGYIMLTPGDGVLARYYRDRGFTVWAQKLETKRRLYPGLHTIQSLLFARKFRQKQVDVVLCNTFAAAARVRTVCRLTHIPYAIYVREFISKKQLHRDILSKANLVLAVSRDVAGYLGDMVDPAKIVLAYDHLNTQPLLERVKIHKARRVRIVPFDPGAPLVGLIGRITRYKQQDLFLRSIPFVLSEIPEARFVVVGASGSKEKDYEQGLKTIALQLGIGDKVAFMGHRPDAVEVMSELSVCCITSDREPFPRTLLEAAAIGCPVVAADTGGCPEMVQDGVTGLLFSAVSPDAPERLAAAVISVLKNPNRASTMALRARDCLRDGVAGLKPVRRLENLLYTLTNQHCRRNHGRNEN